MMDYASAMRGAAPPQVDNAFANLLQLSGDQAMGGLGRSMLQQGQQDFNNRYRLAAAAQSQANTDEANRQTALWRTAQQRMAELRRKQEALKSDRDYWLGLAEEARLLRELEAEENAPPDYQRLTTSAFNSLMGNANVAGSLDSLLERARAAQSQGISLTAPVGAVRDVQNWASANMGSMVDSDTKAIAEFWRAADRFYTLPERNEKFGATLTPSEKQAWKAANPSTGQDMASLISNLNTMATIARDAAQRQGRALIMDEHNPDTVNELLKGTQQPLPMQLFDSMLGARNAPRLDTPNRSILDYGNINFTVSDAPGDGDRVVDMSAGYGQPTQPAPARELEITPQMYEQIARGFFNGGASQ